MLSQILLGKSLATGKGVDINTAINITLKYSGNKALGWNSQFKQELIIEFLKTEITALDIFGYSSWFYVDEKSSHYKYLSRHWWYKTVLTSYSSYRGKSSKGYHFPITN